MTWQAPGLSKERILSPSDHHRMINNILVDDGCWEWMGTVGDNGYGMFWWGGQNRLAHRVVYEWLVGPIPEGLTLDHLCRVRHCVRPDHLEPVTAVENVQRAMRAKTHCPQGHPYDEANTYITRKGARSCRECSRRRRREWWQDRRG